MSPEKDKIKFHFIKSADFRIIHADGIFGGLSPSGEVFFSLFSQRPPIPQVTVHAIKENGELGEEITAERIAKDGIVREVEVGVAMRADVARSVAEWLQAQVKQLEELKAKAEKGADKTTK